MLKWFKWALSRIAGSFGTQQNRTLEDPTGRISNAGLSRFLEALPDGFETQVAPNGKNLPNQYIKRICLLRALLGNPTLLLMEDPWEGLTGPEKQHMIEYLVSKPNQATVVIATSDPYFLNRCDHHIVLSNATATITRNLDHGLSQI
jgi:ATP-binding cassette subfamily B protein